MRKISYTGFYGFQNTGDDAFLEVCAWGGAKFWNAKDNVFLGSNLPVLENDFSSLSPSLIKGDNRIKSFFKISNSDYFISAGGSTFSDFKSLSLKDVALKIQKTINPKLEIGAIGVSVGPFKSVEAEKRVENYLKKMSFLAVRDQKSYDYVSSLNLPYKPVNAFDLAALLPFVYKDKPKVNASKKKKVIGISVCNYETYVGGDLHNEKRRNDFYINLLKELPDDDVIYRFFYFNGNKNIGDKKITDYIISKVNKKNIEIIDYQYNVYKSWCLISECDLVVSTRLHASIFACYANIPFFLVEYHRKCTDFLDSVGQVKEHRLGDADVPYEKVVLKINEILYDNKSVLPSKIEETKEKALLNFTKTIK